MKERVLKKGNIERVKLKFVKFYNSSSVLKAESKERKNRERSVVQPTLGYRRVSISK